MKRARAGMAAIYGTRSIAEMIEMRRVAAGIGVLISVLLSFWAGAKAVLDLVGRALAVEDFSKPDGLVARGVLWVFDTPWWVPAVLATAAVLAVLLLIYLSIRDGRANTTASPTSNENLGLSRVQQQFPTTDWDKPLTQVFRQHYKNETVLLDGKNFIECTFENVTLLYQGTRPIQMINCKKIPGEGFLVTVQTDNPVVFTALSIMQSTGVSGAIELDLRDKDLR
jgi:hypothetical protein